MYIILSIKIEKDLTLQYFCHPMYEIIMLTFWSETSVYEFKYLQYFWLNLSKETTHHLDLY